MKLGDLIPTAIKDAILNKTGMTGKAAGVLKERSEYNKYVIDKQSNGEAAVSFEDWVAGKR